MTQPAPDSSPNPKPRVFALLGALLFAGFLLTGLSGYLISRNSIRKAILQDELPLSSDNIYSEIQRDLFRPILISSLMANDTFVRDWIAHGEQNPDLIIRYLERIQEKYGTITSFLVSEATRNYYHSKSVLKVVREDNPADAWFFRVRTMQDDYEINVDPDMANKNAMTIFINYRVLNNDGQFLAATGVGLTVNAVKHLMQEYRTRYHRDIYFYDRKGNLILHSLAPEEEKNLSRHNSESALHDLLARINSGETKATISAVGKNGAMANYRFIPELNWILVVEQRSDGTRSILLHSIGFTLLIYFITSLLLLKVIRMVMRRYQQKLESRNLRLEEQNAKIAQQANALAEANKKLDALHREKDEFIGITVHDLKNPLHAVLGFTDLLRQAETDAEKSEYIAEIHTSSRNMLEQVEGLLSLTELETPTDVKLENIEVKQLIRRVVESYDHQSRDKEISLITHLPMEPLWVRGHEEWIISSIGNLVSNAIKYSPPGKNVTISLRKGDAAVEIAVTDQGQGISEKDKARLFRKFERLSSRPTGGESSSGLGLYLVQQMVTRMGGRVRCESKQGEHAGSTFTLFLREAHTSPDGN